MTLHSLRSVVKLELSIAAYRRYVIAFRGGRGLVVARSQITAKWSVTRLLTDTPVTSDEEEAVITRSSTFPRLCVASVTFCLKLASDRTSRRAVVAVPCVEIADDDDAGLRSDSFDEFSKLGKEGGERLGVATG